MTLINRLIREAKRQPRPDELIVPRHRVRQVAEHARLLMHGDAIPTCDELERMIVAGEMKLLGIPVRVVGRQPDDPSYMSP